MAILEGFYPSMFGAQVIAETIFGDNNPGGNLFFYLSIFFFLIKVNMALGVK
jgi:hypothetical protein